MKRLFLFSLGFAFAPPVAAATPARLPNVVVILADDLGYGDVTCNRQGRGIHTPAIDRLAAEGMRLTNGYAPASTCTPTRYAMMTGEYAWRKQGTGILPGDAELIISPGRTTLAGIFKDAGYATALIGKWHLGLGAGEIDWNEHVAPGPNEVGFTYSFHMPATGDRVPCVYMENGHVVNLDPSDPITVNYKHKIGDLPSSPKGSIINGIPRMGWMSGDKAALWDDQTKSDLFKAKAIEFIRRNRAKPFFLCYAAHEPHHPQVPNPRFDGKAGCNGARGDAIVQLDDQVADIMKTLREEGLDNDTLVIFSSDNGCLMSHFDPVQISTASFRANGIYRGGKFSEFEGGQRMPFIARWPGRIKAGVVSSEQVSLVDLPATAASLVGRKLTSIEAVDSFNILPVFTEGAESPHTTLFFGNDKADGIREGKWKLITKRQHYWRFKNPGKDTSGPPYLYDLEADPGEANNLAKKHPEIVGRLRARLQQAVKAGFTRPSAATESVPAAVGDILPEPLRGKNYKLVFEENFDGPAGASAPKERWSDWYLGPRKDAFNVPEACRLDGKGNLVITVNRNHGRIEAGGIVTRPKFAATHGYYECRCRMLGSPGAWSAFWLQSPTIGKPVGDPINAGVEMDVIEYFPGHRKYKNQARHTAHWDGYDKRHHKKESVGKAMSNLAADFHAFAMKWDDEGCVFYIDGVESGRLQHTPVSNRPQYMILSCEAAKWSGDISKAKLPDTFVVDHVRVWQTPAQIEADLKRPDAARLRKN